LLVDSTACTTVFDIGSIRNAFLKLLGVPVAVLTPMTPPEKFKVRMPAEAVPV
jgi:hypothetical protein